MDKGPKVALIRFSSLPGSGERLHAFFVSTSDDLVETVAGPTAWTSSIPLHRFPARKVWPPGANVAAFVQGGDQLTVLYVDHVSKTVHARWQGRGQQGWSGPAPIVKNTYLADPGTPIAIVPQGGNRWFVVFSDVNGRLQSIKVEGHADWIFETDAMPASDGVTTQASNLVGLEQAPGLASVLFVGSDGRVKVCWREASDAAWHGPASLRPQHVTPVPPGACLAAARLSEARWWVFYIDDEGTLTANHVVGRQDWQGPEAIAQLGASLRGALVAAVNQTDEQVNVFVVDGDGALRVYWRADHVGAWLGPVKLTPDHFAAPGSSVSAAKQSDDVTVVVVVGGDGRPYVCWVVGTGTWQGPARISWSRVSAADVPDAVTAHEGTSVPGSAPVHAFASSVKDSARHLAQLTGPRTLNSLAEWNAYGVDLGANCEHRPDPAAPSRLYLFAGDVTYLDLSAPGEQFERYRAPDFSPPWDSDLIAFTEATSLQPGGFPVHVVSEPRKPGPFNPHAKPKFHPLTVERLGILGTDEGPTGAFSYDGRAYVFVVAGGNTPISYLTSSDRPDERRDFRLHFKFSASKFFQVAPVVVSNADHPGLPTSTGEGLVMLGHGGSPPGVHLAWMPLERGQPPDRSRLVFFQGWRPNTPTQSQRFIWSAEENDATPLFTEVPGYTAVSLLWMPEPAHWILLYSLASPPPQDGAPSEAARRPIVARVATNFTAWSEPVVVFDPGRDLRPDRIADLLYGKSSWAYGAFLLNRFCRWDPATSNVQIRYLLSLFEPYQLQLMEARIHLPGVRLWRRVFQVLARALSLEWLSRKTRATPAARAPRSTAGRSA